MLSPLEQNLAEKKFTRRLYDIIDQCGLSTAYEGRIERQGDHVHIWQTRQMVGIDHKIPLSDDLGLTLRSFLSQVKWDKINFICLAIVNHELIWGAI